MEKQNDVNGLRLVCCSNFFGTVNVEKSNNCSNNVKKCQNILRLSDCYCVTKKSGEPLLFQGGNIYITEFEVQKLWIKTLLSVYPNLKNVLKILDQIIKNRAINPHLSSFSTTYEQIERIIDFVDRKNKLLNLTILIKKLIEGLDDNDKNLIKMRFIHSYTVEKIAEKFGFTARNVFKRINKTIEKMVQKLNLMRLSSKFIQSQLDGEDWILDRFKANLIEFLKKSKHLNI